MAIRTVKRSSANRNRILVATCVAVLVSTSMVDAQPNNQHKLFRGSDAPGMLAHKRLIAAPNLGHYEQPVNIILPDGGNVSIAGNHGTNIADSQTLLGMRIGPVYRLKVSTDIKGKFVTVYPTVEMLDRLYPPQGLALRYPLNIVLTSDDIEQASKGGLVVKVTYLENPDTALPYQLTPEQQAVLEIGTGQDPYTAADRLGRPMAIVRVGSRQPIAGKNSFAESPVQLFADLGGACASDCGCQICQAHCNCCPEEVMKLPKWRRDEYVCDGNDRKLRAVSDEENQFHGLDLEDTIARFETISGKTKIAPSNRVCIYAPRFAAVRRLMKTSNTTITQKLTIVNDKTQLASARKTEFNATTLQNVQPKLNRNTQRPNSFRDQTRGLIADNTIKLKGARHFFKPFEDLQLIRFGKYEASESARVSLGLQSAVAWEGDVSAQISINNQQPIIVRDSFQLQEIVSIESDTHPDLRLCKLASVISAKPGETVDFTIRFDNIGRERIGNITIVDNLSPRLEYIDGTAECSVEADFSTEANEAGSKLLRWEITKPLDIRVGGIIRFQCRVR